MTDWMRLAAGGLVMLKTAVGEEWSWRWDGWGVGGKKGVLEGICGGDEIYDSWYYSVGVDLVFTGITTLSDSVTSTLGQLLNT